MLTIEIKNFIEAFKAVADFLERPPYVETSLTCSKGKLLVRTEGMEIEIPVQGHYEGVIWLSGEATFGLAQVARHRPPPPDTQVTICDGIMRVGRMTLPVRFEDAQELTTILVPKDAPLLFWLGMQHQYSPAEIALAKLDDALELACEKMDAMIEEGAALLAPLGVKRDNLKRFVEEGIKAQYSKPAESRVEKHPEHKKTGSSVRHE